MGGKEDEKVMAYIRYPSREAKRNYFPVPNCVMELKLPWKKLAVYLYLIHRYRYQYRTGFDYPRMLSESFGISSYSQELVVMCCADERGSDRGKTKTGR